MISGLNIRFPASYAFRAALKSSFCIRFPQNLDTACTEPIFNGGILWCYGGKNSFPSEKLASVNAVGRGEKVLFHEGVPENIINDEDWRCLVILDDLLNEVYSKEMRYLFTKGSPNRNINVILITQNLFHQGQTSFNIWPGRFIQRTVPVCTRGM
jgi:hypothetical protein